jgi:phosphotransacetylase
VTPPFRPLEEAGRGVTFEEAQRRMRMRNYYAAVMLEQGAVDGS